MNKLTKAGIATAAGIALLMGGAGTLAFWNDQAELAGGTVNTGHLTLTSNGDGAWDEDLDFIVPGDTVTYTETLELEVEGDNIKVDIAADTGALATYDAITVTPTVTVLDEDSDPVSLSNLTRGTYTVEVEVVVTFPWGTDTPGDEDEGISIDFNDIVITATQVA